MVFSKVTKCSCLVPAFGFSGAPGVSLIMFVGVVGHIRSGDPFVGVLAACLMIVAPCLLVVIVCCPLCLFKAVLAVLCGAV